ncbi:ribosome small subunit-dependent GTPase A [Streptomyces galbus]|uniref:Small ribosomal subunit biogenesis GTPase RsgA n=1 Tax=Streptomyces galbus TaxID=33898 RepID=A0ABX1IJA1_STRGB|nr:ribosome small subunit-dependent GTPase A [Streptomyces galbus]NKQ24371.1 ribosome small subunit-dependent GTPase A [Streptomyces galbus]
MTSDTPAPDRTPRPAPDPLTAYGWDAERAAVFAPYAADGLAPGRVARVDRGRCEVVLAAGPADAGPDGTVTVHADTRPARTGGDPEAVVCTGDWAAVEPDTPAGPVLRALLPRRTRFLRSTSSARSEGQVLAANTDHAVVVVSLAVELDLGRLERFLSLAWASGSRPLVALTKTDLVPDSTYLVADVEAAAPGAPVLPVSAVTGEGAAALAAELAGGTAVLLGQSGVGKSTLVNALLGAEVRTSGAGRGNVGKGRHTTTARELLPLPGGGLVVDTPGLRGVGLWEADEGLSQVFAEIEELAAHCRFHDCEHHAEPGCAVLAAVDDGTLSHRRFESYRKLLRESAWIASRTDARLRAERAREWRRREAAGREMYERKRGKGHRKAF